MAKYADLENKVVLVTGAGKGIGKAIALAFDQQDAKVIVNDYKIPDNVTAGFKKEPLIIKADISKKEEVENMVKQVYDNKDYERIDVLVNNAGIIRDNLFMRMKDDEWDSVINVNLNGTKNCCKSVINGMSKQRSGCIINIASVIGEMGGFGQTNYAASKAGIIAFTKSLATEYAGRGIRVNAISPGLIETDMTKILSEDIQKKYIEQIPMKRAGKPEEVAQLITFLASNNASYITGQVYRIDGGLVRA